MSPRKATEETEGPQAPLGADPGPCHWGIRWCQEKPWRGSTHAVWGGNRAVTSPLCFLTTKPCSISAGKHWTALVHRVSVTHEEKLGQFVMMLLITGFCSALNEKQVPQAISLKVGPAPMHLCTHTHPTHTKEGKKNAKNKLCLLNCPSENQVPRNYHSCQGNNGTKLFLSVKIIWSKWKQKASDLPLVLRCIFKRWKAHWWTN